MARPPKKRPISVAVYQSKDADGNPIPRQWEAWVPIKDAITSKVIRRAHVRGTSKEACEDNVRELEDRVAAETAAKRANLHLPSGRKVWRVHAWLRYWLYEIKFPNVAYKTFRDYKLTIEGDIIPNLDDCEFPDFESSAIELMLSRIRRKNPGSTDKPNRAYRHLSMALRRAAARPRETGLWHNPIVSVDLPHHESPEAVPFTIDETKRILTSARSRPRNSARWTCGWAFGMRPGEALALKRTDFYLIWADSGERIPEHLWPTVDLDKVLGVLWINENVYRRAWQHGCDDPHLCGANHHKYPCPQTGPKHDRYHKRGCPKVIKYCKPNCAEHAAQCPQRHGGLAADGTPMPGGQVRKQPKSKAGNRKLLLPRQPTEEILEHLRRQDAEMQAAGHRWLNSGALFASKLGGITNERDDYGEFLEILADAGLAPKRPYDGRHGAATLLLLKKVHKRLVMDALGWISEAMLKRYQHIVEEMRREVGDAIVEALWDQRPGQEPAREHQSGSSATDHATGNVIGVDFHRRRRA